jgi:hypothetical protein
VKPARVIWVIWCLLWVLIWLGLTVQQLLASQRCAAVARVVGSQYVHCQSSGYVMLGGLAASASALAIMFPVGRNKRGIT